MRTASVSQRDGDQRLGKCRGGLRSLVAGVILGGLVSGCQSPPTPEVPSGSTRFDGVRLVVGVVGAPGLGRSVEAQRGEWVAATGSEVTVRPEPLDPSAIPAEVDVVVFAGDRLGDLVDANALAVLPEPSAAPAASTRAKQVDPASPDPSAAPQPTPDALRFAEVAPIFREQVGRYGSRRFGLPIGGSALVVAIQRRALAAPAVVAAAQAAGVALEAPTTWEAFDNLARFLHGKDFDGDGQADFGVALGWGADGEGVGDSTFLARAAAGALHPDQYTCLLDSETTEPRVASPPFREALAALVSLRAAGPPGDAALSIDAARAAFRGGRVALLVDRAEAAATWGTGDLAIGVAPLPGSPRVFDPTRNVWEDLKARGEPLSRPAYLPSGGGWCVGVASKSGHRAAAEAFARYLAGPETTDRLRADRDFPMLPTRLPQLAQGLANARKAPGVEARGWLDAVSQTLRAPRSLVSLRIPGVSAYMNEVTTARVAAVTGQPTDEVLTSLAAAWTKRTKDQNLARQTWHHRQSLNGPSTSPEPPPR